MNSKEKQMLIKHYEAFNNTKARTIFEAYSTTPSGAKIDSYNKIIKRLIDNHYVAYDVRITGHNCSFYTLAAKCYDDSQSVFRVFTAYGEYICGMGKDYLYDLNTGEVFYEE